MGDSNSSNFLFQSGGGLQSQPGNPQGNSSNNLFGGSSSSLQSSGGPSRQDLLGEGLKAGEVNFDPSQQQSSSGTPGQPATVNKSFDLTDPVFLAVAAIALVATYFISRKII